MVRHRCICWSTGPTWTGSDARDFTIWLEHNGRQLPWFARGWEEKYLASSTLDRVIYTFEYIGSLVDRLIAGPHGQRVLMVPFERFVLDPQPYLRALEKATGLIPGVRLPRTLRRERVPRCLTTHGRDLGIYRRYGWQRAEYSATETAELERRWKYAEQNASPEALEVLKRLSADYEAKYLKDEAAA